MAYKEDLTRCTLAYKKPYELQSAVDAYFEYCEMMGRRYTLAGLALSLDLTTSALKKYRGEACYAEILSRARQRIEEQWEYDLDNTQTFQGARFKMTVHAGLTDKQDINLGGQEENPLAITVTVKR